MATPVEVYTVRVERWKLRCQRARVRSVRLEGGAAGADQEAAQVPEAAEGEAVLDALVRRERPFAHPLVHAAAVRATLGDQRLRRLERGAIRYGQDHPPGAPLVGH